MVTYDDGKFVRQIKRQTPTCPPDLTLPLRKSWVAIASGPSCEGGGDPTSLEGQLERFQAHVFRCRCAVGLILAISLQHLQVSHET